jgi:hypothetical protein
MKKEIIIAMKRHGAEFRKWSCRADDLENQLRNAKAEIYRTKWSGAGYDSRLDALVKTLPHQIKRTKEKARAQRKIVAELSKEYTKQDRVIHSEFACGKLGKYRTPKTRSALYGHTYGWVK